MAYRQCTPSNCCFIACAHGKVPDEIDGLAGGEPFDDCVATNRFDDPVEGGDARQAFLPCR